MSALPTTLLAVLVSDLAVKLLLRRLIGTEAISLGRLGRVRIIAGRPLAARLGASWSGAAMWLCWMAAAVVLVAVGPWVSASPVFAGLLLGGSLSNVVETSLRGAVSDYVCLRFWPAFNLADLAIAVGAAGVLLQLVIAVHDRAA